MSNNYHLVVDVQVLQTNDRDRGMGKFLKGVLQNIVDNDIPMTWIVSSRLQKLTNEHIELAKSLSAEIIEADLMHRSNNAVFNDSLDHNIAEIDRIISSLEVNEEIKFFVPALFSSDIHPVFPSYGTTNILLFYDLIPFLYPKNYFRDHDDAPRRDYAQRFREFYRADLILTISQTTTDDLIVYLGVDPSHIITIFGAAADRSNIKPRSPKIAPKINKGFVLMPSGDDFRKNNTRAVQAFADLESELTLVITSRFSKGTQRDLLSIHPNIIFAGLVDDNEFLWLMDNAQAVFFPPEYEGLGMPLLEAVERGAVVACSNIPAFIEISEDAFFYFDPTSVSGMKQALTSALSEKASRRNNKLNHSYDKILANFSWQRSAKLFLEGIKLATPAIEKKRLAVFCPSSSSYSAVGKYALEVHAELSRVFNIDYYAENGLTAFEPTRPNILEYAANYYSTSKFSMKSAETYDYILYHLGNSEFHMDTILNALRIPANAIIHDTKLNGIFDFMQRNNYLTKERRELEAKLDEAFNVKDTSCLISLATNQKNVFCHSVYAVNAMHHFVDNPPPSITQLIHPIGVPEIELKKLGKPTVSFAGIISENKGIAIVADIAQNKDIAIKVFGFGVLGDSPLLQKLSENVHVMKDLTDKDFQDNLRQTDILVNYRPAYHGETSRSTLEAMRYGAVVIVRNIGWYGELPEGTVVKVNSENEVVSVVNELIADPEKRRRIGNAARQFLADEYNFRKYASTMREALEKGA